MESLDDHDNEIHEDGWATQKSHMDLLRAVSQDHTAFARPSFMQAASTPVMKNVDSSQTDLVGQDPRFTTGDRIQFSKSDHKHHGKTGTIQCRNRTGAYTVKLDGLAGEIVVKSSYLDREDARQLSDNVSRSGTMPVGLCDDATTIMQIPTLTSLSDDLVDEDDDDSNDDEEYILPRMTSTRLGNRPSANFMKAYQDEAQDDNQGKRYTIFDAGATAIDGVEHTDCPVISDELDDILGDCALPEKKASTFSTFDELFEVEAREEKVQPRPSLNLRHSTKRHTMAVSMDDRDNGGRSEGIPL